MVRYFRHYSRPDRSGRMQSVGNAMPRFLDKLDTTGGLALVRLWDSWDEIMGEMADFAKPLGHRGRKLILAAEDPMVVQEAQFLSPLILETVNRFLGEEVFDKVVFELLNGRVPLDGVVRPEAKEPPRKLKKPDKLGSLGDKLDPETPLGRCYQAYRRMFDET